MKAPKISQMKDLRAKKKTIKYNALILVVMVMHGSRNSSSRALYSVVKSVVHTTIHSAVCMKLVGII